MDQALTLDDVVSAWHARDPRLAELMVALCAQAEPRTAVRDDALTWQVALRRHQDRAFRGMDPEARRQQRLADYRALEAADAEVAPPPRLQLHRVLLELWADGGPWARHQLVRALCTLPLRWGPWRATKRIFKEAEARGDWEIYGAIAARLDSEYAQTRLQGDVRRATLRYLVRRAWRQLRGVGIRMPSTYPDAAVEVLRHYGPGVPLARSWIANHILFHELPGAYTRSAFRHTAYRAGEPELPHRAFARAWQRTPRPLFTLLETAGHDTVRAYAVAALKEDFRTQLRDVEPSWVVRLVAVHSDAVDRFVMWLLDNVPRFEPAAFVRLGLHDAVLTLLDSTAPEAADWAARYARAHARDLPLARLIRLANVEHDEVRKLARDLLRDRDPRTEVGLEAWGRLLGTPHGHDLAVEAIQEHFGAGELTLAWFAARWLSDDPRVVGFAADLLPRVHPHDGVPLSFWSGILDHPRIGRESARRVDDVLARRDVAGIEGDVLRRALLNPITRSMVLEWVRTGRLAPRVLGVGLVKALAHEATFLEDPWIDAWARSDRPWVEGLGFDGELQAWALDQLGDPRVFSASEIGRDWLLELVARSEPTIHGFAVATLTRSFAPADFSDRDDPLDGCEILWRMAVGEGPADEPLRVFALHYLRLHHAGIHAEEVEQALDPEAALPEGFLTLERARTLLADGRAPIRQLGLAWMRMELARWQPSAEALLAMSELPHDDVHGFLVRAVTAEDRHEHRRYRLDPARWTPEGVYRFCESLDPRTRALGMALIARHPRLAVPEELFRLTESPHRQVRAFVVRELWARYRHRASSQGWSPRRGEGPPAAPSRWPAGEADIRAFLRRTLFEIPPGRLEKGASTEGLPALPARQAKLGLIEVCRDLAIEDREFATRITPLFQEFLASQGQSESAACLVALTRIRHRWGPGVGGLPAERLR